MRDLAAFASSEGGKAFARVERYFGRDPAASLEDDVLAHNLRAAFVLSLYEGEAETVDEDPGEAARAGGAKVRAAMHG